MAGGLTHTRKAPLQIQGSEVTGTPAELIFKLKWDGNPATSNLPADMFTTSTSAQSDGGDIRVTTDSAGVNLVPIHIRDYFSDGTSATAYAEIAAEIDTTGSNQTIWIWWNTTGTDSQPSRETSGGSEGVYSICFYASPMDKTGSTPTFTDQSPNSADANSYGSLATTATGNISRVRQNLDGSGDYFNFATNGLSNTSEAVVVFSCWVEPNDISLYMPIFASVGDTDTGDFSLFIDSEYDEIGILVVDNDDGEGGNEYIETQTFNSGTEYHIAMRYNSTIDQTELYVNGASVGTVTWDTSYPLRLQEACRIARDNFTDYANIKLDEILIIDDTKGDNWLQTYYDAWATPQNFISAGPSQAVGPVTPEGSGALTLPAVSTTISGSVEVPVVNVTSPDDDGTYIAGQTLYLCVEFSDQVSATGTPQLDLDVKVGGRKVDYVANWTPSEIVTSGWWDTTDESTITTAAGGVSSWADKSGMGNSLIQATEGDRPDTGVREINDLNVFDCDGDGHLEGNVTLPSDGNMTFFGIYVIDSLANANDSVFCVDATNDLQFASDSTVDFDGEINQSNIGDDVVLSGGPFNGPSTFSVVMDFTSQVYYVNIDGIKRTPDVLYDDTLDTSQTFGAFRNRGGIRHPNGAFGEFLIVPDVSTATIQKVEGYLAWKWGLVDNLPSGHPYKTKPPLVE